jgi:molybdenum cofactor synthesis domain-containing protein
MARDAIEVVSVNISEEKGTVKHPVPEITIVDTGIVADAHAGMPNREVSLLARESAERFSREIGRDVAFGEFAENITTRGLDMREVYLLDRLRIGEVELEVTQIGKKCHGENCAIFREVGRCVMPKEGIFCRVIRGGVVKAGDPLTHTARALRCRIITLSDRASRGEYEDRSGPRVKKLLEEFMRDKRWHLDIETGVIPDDSETLVRELRAAREAACDLMITTGGTGVGPRDITPDVVAKACDKLIPGIMEHIRTKYGADKPAALLSRGVAGVIGRGLVFTLPGSVKAVEEYMVEILKTLEHLVWMLRGLDVHKH